MYIARKDSIAASWDEWNEDAVEMLNDKVN